jgi:hypothetical protein
VLPFFLVGGVLLMIGAVAGYHSRNLGGDMKGYRQSPAGWLLSLLDNQMALAGGLAFAYLVRAFHVEEHSIAAGVLAMLKGGICTLIGAGVLIVLLRFRSGLGLKMVLYCGVLIAILFSMREHQRELDRRAEARAHPHPLICKPDHNGGAVCGRP